MSYKTYIENMQSRWWNQYWEYWDLDDHTPDKACVLPIEDMEDYEVTYKMGHKWSERELMNLRFNLEEVNLNLGIGRKSKRYITWCFPQE